MDNSNFEKLAGMLAKIAYELHDKDYIDDALKEMLFKLWREFDHYSQSND